MRPTGEIRKALRDELQRGSGHMRDLAERACVGTRAASVTLHDMVRAGEVLILDRVATHSARQRVPVYGLHLATIEPPAMGHELQILWLDMGTR